MDSIDRYVYAVTKALPLKQREDIEKELRTLIDDMLEQYEDDVPEVAKVQKVLLELGNPEVLADNYRGSKRYLIGPQNYDKYLFILRIVSGAVFLGISISYVIGFLSTANQNIAGTLGEYFATLFSAILQAFAWITLGFAIAERSGKKVLDDETKGDWQPSDLPEVPHKKAVIPPSEPIISIVASAIFIMILYSAPQVFAVYIPESASGTAIIPIFNIAVLKGYRLIFAGIFILSVSKEVLKLISGKWTLKVSVPFAILSVASMVLTLLIFTNPAIWNPNFATDILRLVNIGSDFAVIWAKLTSALILIIVAACILEVSTAIYKGMKYNIVK